MTAAQRKLAAYRKDTLRSVETFKYLGRTIARDDCDTSAIRSNLKRARQIWERISKVIAKEEVQPRVAACSTRPLLPPSSSMVARCGASPTPPGAPSTASTWRQRGTAHHK